MMKKLSLTIALSTLLLLGACSGGKDQSDTKGSTNDGEAVNQYGTIDHGVVEDTSVGFSMDGDTIEEAAGVPAEEKLKLEETFAVYIESFNEQDVNRYIDTLSSENFDLAEEREVTENVFAEAEVTRDATNITIVRYTDMEAQVYSDMTTVYKQLSSGLETKQTGRQVTVFTKTDGEWKVLSLSYIGNEA